MSFTQTSENVAIFCLAKNEWKLEQASDNFFQNPLEYDNAKINAQISFSVDKKRLESMYARYRGRIYFISLFIWTYLHTYLKYKYILLFVMIVYQLIIYYGHLCFIYSITFQYYFLYSFHPIVFHLFI